MTMRPTRNSLETPLPAPKKKQPWENDFQREMERKHSAEFSEAVKEDMEEARERVKPKNVAILLEHIPENDPSLAEDKEVLRGEYEKAWSVYAENQARLKETAASMGAYAAEQKNLRERLETAQHIDELKDVENQLLEVSRKKADVAALLNKFQMGEIAYAHSLMQTVDHIENLAKPFLPLLEAEEIPAGPHEKRASGIRRKPKEEELESTGTDDGDFNL